MLFSQPIQKQNSTGSIMPPLSRHGKILVSYPPFRVHIFSGNFTVLYGVYRQDYCIQGRKGRGEKATANSYFLQLHWRS